MAVWMPVIAAPLGARPQADLVGAADRQELSDRQCPERLVTVEEASGDKPRRSTRRSVGCGMLTEPGDRHDTIADLHSHRVIADPHCHDWTPPDPEVR